MDERPGKNKCAKRQINLIKRKPAFPGRRVALAFEEAFNRIAAESAQTKQGAGDERWQVTKIKAVQPSLHKMRVFENELLKRQDNCRNNHARNKATPCFVCAKNAMTVKSFAKIE